MAFFKKSYFAYISILSFVAVLLLAWISPGRHGLIDLYKMQKEKEEYLAIIRDLKEKNRLLAAEIRRLREDKEYLESVARKELGLIKDNEIIYRFKEDWEGNKKRK
ncbi:MAG: septum formation initiator family protein [Desulfobacterales bacterium]|nr:septum formation initiator family protein [Desulfobacterales bacterium]